jgi:hypothetical protein
MSNNISIITEEANMRQVGKYTFNTKFCLGEGAYGFYILKKILYSK